MLPAWDQDREINKNIKAAEKRKERSITKPTLFPAIRILPRCLFLLPHPIPPPFPHLLLFLLLLHFLLFLFLFLFLFLLFFFFLTLFFFLVEAMFPRE